MSEKNEESPDRPRDSTTPVDDATLLTDEEGRSDAVKYDRLGVYLIEAHVGVDTGRDGVADD